MWFNNVAVVENPGREELQMFVKGVRDFLGFVIENTSDFGFLWKGRRDLHELAEETFRYDITEGAGLRLDGLIWKIPKQAIEDHGLEGRPLKFKLQVLDSIEGQWERVKEQFSIREWFKKMVDAIDAILDSLIDAAGGAGGLIKEFKDAISALA